MKCGYPCYILMEEMKPREALENKNPRDGVGSELCHAPTLMCQRRGWCVHQAEKAMATHSSVLAWRIPGTGEHGGLPSMGSHRVGHD